MTEAIVNALAMLRAVGETAGAKYEHAREEDVRRLNAAARSMQWLASRIETDDEANMLAVAIQAALAVGNALNPDQWAALNAKFGAERTEVARDTRTAAVKRRQDAIKSYLANRPDLASLGVTKLAGSLVADVKFKKFLESRRVLIQGEVPRPSTMISDIKAIRSKG